MPAITILIVDDNAALRTLWADALSGPGRAVIHARDGDEGVAQAKKHAPHIAIVDVIMPGQDGVEVMARLRNMSADMRIIGVSGGGSTRTDVFLEAAKQLGADVVLQKPVDVVELIGLVDRAAKSVKR